METAYHYNTKSEALRDGEAWADLLGADEIGCFAYQVGGSWWLVDPQTYEDLYDLDPDAELDAEELLEDGGAGAEPTGEARPVADLVALVTEAHRAWWASEGER